MKIIFFILICFFSGDLLAKACEGDQFSVPATQEAIEQIKIRANNGNIEATNLLGIAYLQGTIVEKNIAKAIQLLETSANSGDGQGAYLLGKYYSDIAKSDADFKTAVHWYEKSSNNNCPAAQLAFGLHLTTGKGVDKDIKRGHDLIYKAVDSGYVYAIWWLGTCLVSGGFDFQKDIQKGVDLIQRAAATGDSISEITLANLYLAGTTKEPAPETAQKILEGVYQKHDSQSSMAAYILGWMYMEGKGASVDLFKAFHWMVIAASFNVSDSVQRLKTLTEQLPKQKLAAECSVYMDPSFLSNGAKEYKHVSAGETIILLNAQPAFDEVYFLDQRLVGFIPQRCLQIPEKK